MINLTRFNITAEGEVVIVCDAIYSILYSVSTFGSHYCHIYIINLGRDGKPEQHYQYYRNKHYNEHCNLIAQNMQ